MHNAQCTIKCTNIIHCWLLFKLYFVNFDLAKVQKKVEKSRHQHQKLKSFTNSTYKNLIPDKILFN